MTECGPAAMAEIESMATPEPFSVAVPNVVVPLLNVTDPVGVPETDAVTVAVKRTELPK